MSEPSKKPIIGILGGIASGKSTVAAEFGKLGCKVIDADKIAHELFGEDDIKQRVVESFGPDILDEAGEIDRAKLAEIVFSDAEKLSTLNGIVHPPVLERTEQLIEQYNSQDEVKAIVVDMPLLVEAGFEKRCDRLIFVDCEEKIRGDRAQKMGLFDKNKLKMRENFQISLDIKAGIAENTISNSSDCEALVKQVIKIFSEILGG